MRYIQTSFCQGEAIFYGLFKNGLSFYGRFFAFKAIFFTLGYLDITVKCKQFGLDAVAVIFLGSDIGSLKGSEEGKELIEDMSLMLSYAGDLMHLPKWALDFHPNFKKMSNLMEINNKRVITLDKNK